jgi:hypothetical protein
LQDFLSKFSPTSEGSTWGEGVQQMLADHGEAAIIAKLVHELASGRTFDRPVRVDTAKRRVADGMRSVVASILFSAETIEFTQDIDGRTVRRGRHRGARLRERELADTGGYRGRIGRRGSRPPIIEEAS